MHSSDRSASEVPAQEAAIEAPAPIVAAPAPGLSVARALGELVQTVILALLLFLIIRNFMQNYRVENISMEPNLHEGQFLIINRYAYCPGFHLDVGPLNIHAEKVWCLWTPKRGDVVVFHYPLDPSKDFIKRVIGLPGETVGVRAGRVYINGEMMSEPFGPNPGTYDAAPITLKRGQVYVLGDNRNSSADSHVWGPVPMEDMVGRALVRYWPPSKWSLIPQWNFPELAGVVAKK
ncbi:MAG TPA: signal peptidase I [Anaerolineae bacterium]